MRELLHCDSSQAHETARKVCGLLSGVLLVAHTCYSIFVEGEDAVRAVLNIDNILFMIPYIVFIIVLVADSVRRGYSLLAIAPETIAGIVLFMAVLAFVLAFVHFDLYRGAESLTLANLPAILLAWAIADVIICAAGYLWFDCDVVDGLLLGAIIGVFLMGFISGCYYAVDWVAGFSAATNPPFAVTVLYWGFVATVYALLFCFLFVVYLATSVLSPLMGASW